MQNCVKCKNGFDIPEREASFYKKFGAPSPAMCPDCRLQHRLNFRNERSLYKRTSSLSGKSIISIYRPDSPYPVYAQDEWWSDKWDGLKFGQDFDFNRPFFEQFQELRLRVPRIALFNVNPTNSDYCQQAYNNKNCYLCMVVKECEDCMYVTHSNNMTTCYDCNYLHDSELCYECIDSDKLYGCVGCQSCQNSNDLFFCYDCIGCHDCVGCIGLRNKQYYIMNEQLTKEAYFDKIKNLDMGKHSKYLNANSFFLDWVKNLPHRLNRNFNIEDSDGNYLSNAQRCYECFDSYEIQDCANCTWIFNSHDCEDVYGMGFSELVLESLGVEKLNNCAFDTFVSDSSDTMYSDLCFYSMNLFGCVGLKNKKYCILNKQYDPNAYADLKFRIIEHMRAPASAGGGKKTGEWGQFFPANLAPFAYNETPANIYFPLSKSEISEHGFVWKPDIEKTYLPQKNAVPDDIADVDKNIENEILACEECMANFKIPAAEFSFYKKKSLPIPRRCPDCRYKSRISLRNPRKVLDRVCDKCNSAIKTTYQKDRPEKIYCEKCYKETVN